MQIRMANAERLSQEQIEEFLKASQAIEFCGQSKAGRYQFVQRVLVAQEYLVQGKKQRGRIRAYLSKVTGLSWPQLTRLIRTYRQGGVVEPKAYRRPAQPAMRPIQFRQQRHISAGVLSGETPPAALRGRGLRDPLREAEEFAAGRAILEARSELGTLGSGSTPDERHRVGPKDGYRQSAAVAARQDRIAAATQKLTPASGKWLWK